jgi:hypothetical protein
MDVSTEHDCAVLKHDDDDDDVGGIANQEEATVVHSDVLKKLDPADFDDEDLS